MTDPQPLQSTPHERRSFLDWCRVRRAALASESAPVEPRKGARDLSPLGEIIGTFCAVQCISYNRFSVCIKTPASTVHGWVYGDSFPTIHALKRVAVLLGKTLEELPSRPARRRKALRLTGDEATYTCELVQNITTLYGGQKPAAAAMGVSLSTFSNWASGRYIPSLKSLALLEQLITPEQRKAAERTRQEEVRTRAEQVAKRAAERAEQGAARVERAAARVERAAARALAKVLHKVLRKQKRERAKQYWMQVTAKAQARLGSAVAVGQAVGVSKTTVYLWLKGQCIPSKPFRAALERLVPSE